MFQVYCIKKNNLMKLKKIPKKKRKKVDVFQCDAPQLTSHLYRHNINYLLRNELGDCS